jgi:type IV secretory pathway TrbD component
MTATETIVALSIWTAATGGLPLWTVQLTASQAVNNGDTLTLNTCSLSVGPLAV